VAAAVTMVMAGQADKTGTMIPMARLAATPPATANPHKLFDG
jgi:hypothetical protein